MSLKGDSRIEVANAEENEEEKLQIEHATESDDQPNIDLAVRMSMDKRPSTVNPITGIHVLYSYWSFKTTQFQMFGVGIYLYFKFLKQLAKLFIFLFILSLPLTLSNLASQKIDQTALRFEQTTIGNLGDVEEFDSISYPDYIDMSFLSDFKIQVNANTNSIKKADAGIVFGWSDLIGVISFLLFLVYVDAKLQKEAIATDDANITVSDYTIQVTGLPKECYNREEIQHHFQKKNDYGQVVDVAICYNDTGIIRRYMDKCEVMEKYQSAIKKESKRKKIESLKKKINKINAQISKIKKKYSKYAICAYVTFNDVESVKKVLYDYPDTFLARCFMKKTLKFRNKHKLKISKANEPSEIIYDNMKYSKCNVFLRRSLTFVLSLVAIGVSCGMSLIAAQYRKEHEIGANEVTDDCPVLTYDEVTSEWNSGSSTYDDHCLCSQLTLTQTADHRNHCSEYLQELLISNVLIGSSALIIIIINLALKFISRCLVNFEKHTSITKMERELTWKMFVGLFFNTGVIILCVNAYIDAVNVGFLFKGEYDDFVPEWYEIVGASLLLTMILNMVNPHLIPVVTYPCKKCNLWCKVRKIKNTIKKGESTMTQRELNSVFVGQQFTLAERYAIICNTIYVAYFYSSGMPVMLLLAAFTFIITYLCDKFVILKNCNNPPMYNEDIAKFSLKLIKPVIYIHLAVSIWVYGSNVVMESHELDIAHLLPDTSFAENFHETVFNWSCLPLFVALLVLLTFDIVKNILVTFRLTACVSHLVKRLLLCICPCCCKKCIKLDNAIHIQEDIDLFTKEMEKGVRFESYLVSFQDLYEQAYYNREMNAETKGLLIKEEPLYVKQNLIGNMNIEL